MNSEPASPATDDQATVLSTLRPKPRAGPGITAGTMLGPYELLEPIGVGGMAAVFKARDPQLDRFVALKVLPPVDEADADPVERFRREARAAAKLDHDHVARVYQFGHDQGLYFIAFEFVEGINLRERLDRDGPLPIAEGTRYLTEVARGLAHAAGRGVVHRDLKPSNIILDAAGRAKIVDMGLARQIEPAGPMTQSGVTLGTFDYIAPEQALDPRTADVRSDIYSLGCTFYHALTGQPPVPEGTAAMKLHHHQQVAPVDPRSWNPDIPAELADILAQMMAKNPAERFQSADDLVTALERFARSAGIDKAGPTSTAVALTEPTARPAPNRDWLWAALAVAVTVMLIEWSAPRLPPGEARAEALRRLVTPEAVPSNSPATPPAPVRPPSSGSRDAATVGELVELLRQPVAKIRLTGSEYWLDGSTADAIDDAALVFEGRSLVMTAADPSRPPVIRLADEWTNGGPRTLISIAGDGRTGVVFRGIRFRLDRPAPRAAPVTLVSVRSAERIEFDQCSWEALADSGDGPLTGLRVETDRAARDPIDLRVSQCQFLGGGTAIDLSGRVSAWVSQSVIGPHATLFRGHGQVHWRLDHCTALLDAGTVFAFDDGAGGSVRCGASVFARSAGEGGPGRDLVLLRKSGAKGDVSFRSAVAADGTPAKNLVYRLGAVWAEESADGPIRAATADDARRLKLPFDAELVEPRSSPWQAADPLARFADDPRAAFALNPHEPAARSGAVMLGAHQVGPARLYPQPLPDVPAMAAPTSRIRIVDPTRETDSREGVYRTLAQVIPDAAPGDTILIRANGSVDIAPVRLEDPETRLTVKPYPGFRPELVLAATSLPNPSLFFLGDGRLTLESLQIRSASTGDDPIPVGLVTLGGSGRCEVRRCVVTLASANGARPFVAGCPEPDHAIEARGWPALELRDCLIRGRGDLVAADVNRRFDLTVSGSVVAVDGDLVQVSGVWQGRSANGPRLDLERATLVGGLYAEPAVRSADPQPRPPARIDARQCVFDTPAGRPWLLLGGLRSADDWNQRIRWSGGRSWYVVSPAETAVELADPLDPDRGPVRWDFARWFRWTRPGAGEVGSPRFATRVEADALVFAWPDDFRLVWPPGMTPTETGIGADLGQVPAPVGEMPRGPLP